MDGHGIPEDRDKKGTVAYAVFALLFAACAPPVGYEQVHDSFVASYDLRVLDASSGFDRSVFDDSIGLAVTRLSAIYDEPRIEELLAAVTVTVQDAELPCSDYASGRCNGHMRHEDVRISLWHSDNCAAYTSLAHELSHEARWVIDGDSDPDHHDTRLFDDDCRDDACRTAAVEHARVEGREAFCGKHGST